MKTVEELRRQQECGKMGCPCGGRGNTHCPAHPDKKPSFSLSQGKNGRPIFYCFSGCDYRSILTAFGMDLNSTKGSNYERRII